jgi:hypothetical protein
MNCKECIRGFEQSTTEILYIMREHNHVFQDVYGLCTYYRNFYRLQRDKFKIKILETIIESTFDYIDLLNNNTIAYDQYAGSICVHCMMDYNFNNLPKNVEDFILRKLFNLIIENPIIFEQCDDESIHHVKFQLIYFIKFYFPEYKEIYKKIFTTPYELRLCNIPKEHYIARQNSYFDDVIAGHPMASNGWCAESLQELIEMGVIVD